MFEEIMNERNLKFMGRPISPLTERRLSNFRANKRGYWSLWIFVVLFIFTLLAFCYKLATTLKILESFDGNDWPIKHAIRPLIPMVAILIRYFSL